jgi:hypothetical protein
MSEQTRVECNFFDDLADSFYAALPEDAANRLADFKKDVLKGIRSAVDSFVDTEITWTDSRLENARRMREERERRRAADGAPPNPA